MFSHRHLFYEISSRKRDKNIIQLCIDWCLIDRSETGLFHVRVQICNINCLIFLESSIFGNYHAYSSLYTLGKTIIWYIVKCCTRTRNKPVSNLSNKHQSIHSWMMFLFLFLLNISYNGCLCENNVYSSFYIWYIVKCQWLWTCFKRIFICVSNQIGINETMVRTALVLCTNSRFFALGLYKFTEFRVKISVYGNQTWKRRLWGINFYVSLLINCWRVKYTSNFYSIIDFMKPVGFC